MPAATAGRYDPSMKLDDRRRAMVTDVLLAVGMFVLGIGAVINADTTIATDVRPADSFAYLLVGVQTIPLIWRRRAPLPVLVIVVGGFLVDRGLNYPGGWAAFGMAFAVYTVGAQLEPRRSLIVGGITVDIALAWTAIGVFVYDVEPIAILSVLAFLGFPLLIGRETYQRQHRLIELESRAIRAEHEREQRAIEAVGNERIRIARELHDVVAHEITVMTVQSAGARRVLKDDPGRAAEAMESAEAAGHRALTEMRRLLGMLRTADPKSIAPQPGLSSLDALVEQMELAGLPTQLSITGDARKLPAGIDLNAYRIIQESLTNTLKHGGPRVHAEVLLDYDDALLTVEVRDNGRGAAAAVRSQSGNGIMGMNERIALLEGSIQTGPRPGGGFRVAAKIPIQV